jgi:hypothetical protein
MSDATKAVLHKIERFYREMMSMGQAAYQTALNGEDPEMMKAQQLRKADDKSAAVIDAARAAKGAARYILTTSDVRAAEELERAGMALATVIESEMNRRLRQRPGRRSRPRKPLYRPRS